VSPLEQLGFWRIVLVSQTNSVAAQMAAHLWRRHAWVVTGTPISSSVQEVNGLLDFLAHDFGSKELWRTTLHDPFVRERSAAGLCRMRALLRDVLLRRTKRQPHIQQQMNLPPLTWHSLTAPLASMERKAYDKAAAALGRSYSQFKLVLEGQSRLRRRAVTGGGGGGFDGKNAAAKKSARFIGDVTRLRQTCCHPQIVRKSDSMLGGKRLTMQEIMAKLIDKERSAACAASVSCLRAQIIEAMVKIAPPNPTSRRSDAMHLALWGAAHWTALSKAVDELEAEGAKTQEAQKEQTRADLETTGQRDGGKSAAARATSGDAEERPATAASVAVSPPAAAAGAAGSATRDVTLTKAWTELAKELAALRRFVAAQTAAAPTENAADPGQAQPPAGPAAPVGSRTGTATSAAARLARARAAPPKLASAALAFVRRADGGAGAAAAAVGRERRRCAGLEHSLTHLRSRATEAKALNVERGAGGGGALERQCPICLDGLESGLTLSQ
jgi:E3 ubiquitin-protein ligase SHPRH